jgi:hypothetical protein
MTWSVLTVVGPDTPPHPFVPVPGEQPDTVVLEPSDGPNGQYVLATSLWVYAIRGPGQRNLHLAHVSDVKAQLLITDQRVAVACSKYEKGGGWAPLGGVASGAIALTANAVSKARASSRRRGKMLVGHVRYPWVGCVGFKERTGLMGMEQVRIGLINPVGGESNALFLDVGLPKNLSSKEVARAITQRVAKYQLADTENVDPANRSRLEILANAQPLTGDPNRVVCYYFRDMPPPLQAAFSLKQ